MATRPKGNVKQLIATQAIPEKTAYVGGDKRVSVNIASLAGSTVDVIGYTITQSEADDRNLVRTKYVLEAGVTAPYNKSTTGPMAEVGIEITVWVGDVSADLMVSSLAAA